MAKRKHIPTEHLSVGFWARFDAKTRPAGPCIEWTGGLSDGYGAVARPAPYRGYIRAHRLAWVRANGPIPDHLCVLHSCDNRKCVNAGHLFLGTVADNNADRDRKGRHRCLAATGEINPMARLRAMDVQHIRLLGALRMMHADLAAMHGVSRQAIDSAILGKTWGWLPPLDIVE